MKTSTRIGLGILAVCLAPPVESAQPPTDPVRIEGERIVLATPLRFNGPVLEPELAGVEQVDALAAFLIETPGIVRMSIEAHGADGDLRDSIDPGLRRARLIREGLIRAGVDPLRVEAISSGEKRPIADPRKPESKAIDRRIELRIVKRRPPGARYEEAAEMIALSSGAPPERAALCLPAKELLDARGAGPVLRGWVAYWLGPGRRWFSRWRSRCRVIQPLVEPLAGEVGLPDAWRWLMMIESGCNPEARSRLGALGLWQLMPATARALGLEVSPGRDDRRRLGPATRAAGKLLSQLHARFGAWEPALTAYNAGPGAVEAGSLTPEGRNFVPKIRAARWLDTNWEDLSNCPRSGQR